MISNSSSLEAEAWVDRSGLRGVGDGFAAVLGSREGEEEIAELDSRVAGSRTGEERRLELKVVGSSRRKSSTLFAGSAVMRFTG